MSESKEKKEKKEKNSKETSEISIGSHTNEMSVTEVSFPLSGNSFQSLDSQISKDDSLIPLHPTSIYICASIGKSKTTTILNMILNKDVYYKKFDEIIVISPSYKSDEKWSLLSKYDVLKENTLLKKHLENDNIIKKPDPDLYKVVFNGKLRPVDFNPNVDINIIIDLVKRQEYIIEKYGKNVSNKVFLVIDDSIAETQFFKNSIFKDMLLRLRHLNITVLISSQDYKSLPKVLRNNVKNLFLSKSPSDVEMKLIYDENKGNKTFKEMMSIFKGLGKYDYLQISYNNSLDHQLIKNIESYIS